MSILSNSNVKITDDYVKQLVQGATMYNRHEIEWYDKFNRFGCLDPYNSVKGSREYIFITKPDLHIFKNGNINALNDQLAAMPFWREAHERYFNVLRQLQISHINNNSPFINLISNAVKNTLELPGVTASEMDTAATIYGDAVTYRWSSVSSDTNHEFQLDFEDTKYLEVYMLFKIYDEYEKLKSEGGITPPNPNYRLNKVLHDQSCAYKIIVGEDGETILYYAKLWGVYPKSVPREAFSSLDKAGGLEFNVSFHSEFVDDMDPLILSEFNDLTSRYMAGKTHSPIYNTRTKSINGIWVGMPYVTYERKPMFDPLPQYKLKWRS